MISFPKVLAGPILRRVQANSVVVWLATSEPMHLELRVFTQDGGQVGCSVSPNVPVLVAEPTLRQQTVQLGKQLFVTLLEAQPSCEGAAFPLETLLQYSIFDFSTQAEWDLSEYVLAGARYPSFYIPRELRVIAYGSCRKPHGLSVNDEGVMQHTDSLALLAKTLDSTQSDVSMRPAMLFLVGDQIYADDVLPPLMAFIQVVAAQLVDYPSVLFNGESLLHLTPDRRRELTQMLGFTSSSSNLHVLSFGEYAVLYLTVLGNRLGFALTPDPENADEVSLHAFIDSQAEVRRVLANVPTYMSFDDHDITDDWNLCRSWYDGVRDSDHGVRVVSNALAAYWAFQGWGNQPSATPKRFFQVVTDYLQTPTDVQRGQDFDFYTWKFRRWHFVLPTNPPVFVLDSRTQRDFGAHNEPPQLLDRYALDWVKEQWIRLQRELNISPETTAPIFVTGTPVFGFSTIEWLQYALYHLGVAIGNVFLAFSASGLDVESWIANRRGFSSFLDTLLLKMGLRNVTFLSGDVHYSFVNRAMYTNYANLCEPCSDTNSWQHSPTLHCLQLTSSAMRNTPDALRYLESFFANWVIKHKQGHVAPERLPWWERWQVWRLFRYDTWKIRIEGVAGECETERKFNWWHIPLVWRLIKIERNGRVRLVKNRYWITSRPNVALVYLEHAKVVKQVLLSGDDASQTLTYRLMPTDRR